MREQFHLERYRCPAFHTDWEAILQQDGGCAIRRASGRKTCCISQGLAALGRKNTQQVSDTEPPDVPWMHCDPNTKLSRLVLPQMPGDRHGLGRKFDGLGRVRNQILRSPYGGRAIARVPWPQIASGT